jgi:hypothetical protein
MARIQPTHAIPSDVSPRKESQFMDILLVRRMLENYTLSDSEAKALYEAWEKTPPGSRYLDSSIMGDKYVASLNKKRYIERRAEGFVLTEHGRKVIIEMVTNQPNAFDKKASPPSYSQIKSRAASLNKRAVLKRKKAYNLKEAKKDALRLTKHG